MNLSIKWAYLCTLLFLSATAYNQCISGLQLEAFNNESTLYSCPGQANDIVSVKTLTAATPTLYVVTDINDTIRLVSATSQIDFSTLKGFEYRIYGYSYKGNVNKVIGLPISSAMITSLCFARSTNFITVKRGIKNTPFIEPNLTLIYACAPDAKPDLIPIDATISANTQAKYIVTDSKNNVLSINDIKTVDVNPLNCDTCKLYAVGYIGNFNAKVGTSLSTVIESNCATVSENFISVVRGFPKGGRIQLVDTINPVFVCKASIQNQILNARLINSSGGNQAFVLTDTSNKVITVQKSSYISALALGAGICKIWGLTYTGILTPSKYSGRLIKSVLWSDDCFALTENSLTVIKSLPNGGNISFVNSNARSIQTCKSESSSTIKLTRSNAQGAQAVFVLTDTNNKILSWTSSDQIDPAKLSIGDYRIYNLEYTGNLSLKNNDLISSIASTDCYDYSDDYLSIHLANDAQTPNPLTFTDQTIDKFLCAFDSSSAVVKFNYSAPTGTNNVFLLTDGEGFFITSFEKNEIDLSKMTNMRYKIYAASYIGLIKVKVGENINSTTLFSGCYKISSPLLINKDVALAGNIAFSSGKDSLLVCFNPIHTAIHLSASTKHNTSFAYVLTTENDTVIKITQTDSFEINNTPNGIFKIWGLAYTGLLQLMPGDFIRKNLLSTGCYDLTIHPLILIKDIANGGSVALNNGDSTYIICYRDGRPDLLSLRTTSTSRFSYQYVATDNSNRILSLNINKTNLELINNPIAKIFGVSYFGDVIAKIGDDIKSVPFSSGCFDISINQINIQLDEIGAGTIRSNKNSDIISYCLDDYSTDTIRFSTFGATGGTAYRYIGIQADTIRFVSQDGILFSKDIVAGSTKVYGVAFKGTFLAKSKDKLSATVLADSCYGISANTINIEKHAANAGMVTTGSGIDLYLCPGDGVPDFISLSHIGAAPLDYGYLITNSNDSILAFSASDIVDLDTFPLGLCKIYGMSYQGNIQVKNKNIRSGLLATTCYSVSTNNVNVFKSMADGGRVGTNKGDSIINICVEDLAVDTIRFVHSSNIKLKYAYLVTDTLNKLQSIIDQNDLHDFNGSDPGVCRIYGVSYGGFLNVFRNDDVTRTRLSSGCNDLSDNFLTLIKSNSGNLCKNFKGSDENNVFRSAYPNPSSDLIHIKIRSQYLKSGHPVLTVANGFGEVRKKIFLDSKGTDNEDITIDTQDLTSGIYFLMFKNGYIFDKLKIIVIK